MAAPSEIEKLEARFNENPEGRFFAPLADAYRKSGRVDDAIVMVTSNLPKHPDYLSAHIVLGRCYLDKKDDTNAIRAFEKVLELDGENIIALKSLAEISERTGQTDEARRWLMRLLTVDQMNTEAEEDLNRLGGPIPDAAAAAASEPAADAGPHISFQDLVEPELPPEAPPEPPPAPVEEPAAPSLSPTVPVPAITDFTVPRTLERPAIRPPSFAMTEEKTFEMTATPPPAMESEPAPPPMMDLEPTSFEAPAEPAAPSADIQPFDDQLAWGAGDRQSQTIHQEDIKEAEAHHEQTASAIDFLGSAAPAPPVPTPVAERPNEERTTDELDADERKVTRQRLSESEFEGFGVAPTHDADAAELPPLVLDTPMEPPTVATQVSEPPADLKLIMPEDVTPAEEMRRPSLKQVQSISEEPVSEPAGAPLATETMGDLYLRQGLKAEAADVYRRLLEARPDDAGLRAKLAAIESPQPMSAAALGTEAVGSWLRRIARAVLPGGAPETPPAPPPAPSPMDQAFADAEQETGAAMKAAPTKAAPTEAAPTEAAPTEAAPTEPGEAAPAGEPARPASTAFSLDQIFGGQPAAGTPAPAPPKHTLGASFDEFFGASPAPAESARPKESGEAPKAEGDDLSAFNAWLHGLKG